MIDYIWQLSWFFDFCRYDIIGYFKSSFWFFCQYYMTVLSNLKFLVDIILLFKVIYSFLDDITFKCWIIFIDIIVSNIFLQAAKPTPRGTKSAPNNQNWLRGPRVDSWILKSTSRDPKSTSRGQNRIREAPVGKCRQKCNICHITCTPLPFTHHPAFLEA